MKKRVITLVSVVSMLVAIPLVANADPMRTMPDGNHFTSVQNGVIVKHQYSDGVAVDTLFGTSKQKSKIKFSDYEISNGENVLLLKTESEQIYRHSSKANYYIYYRNIDSLRPLSNDGKQQEATLSPNGKMVAYVRDGNLFVLDIYTNIEKQVTYDGAYGKIINGIPDWVYEEEFAFSRAYEWSPSSESIAFYRFDEREVKKYNMNVFGEKLYPDNVDFKYPKAGEKNSEVSIKVYSILGGSTVTVDIGHEKDMYIPRIKWTEIADVLAVHRTNRLQNRYDLLLASALNGNSREVYTENSDRYVEHIGNQKVTFLQDGRRMIVKNETSGYRHLYLYDVSGKMLSTITSGEWEVIDICGIDQKNKYVYYTSSEVSPLEKHLYRVKFNGKGKQQLTHDAGTNNITMSENAQYYIKHHNSVTTPNISTLHYAVKDMQLRVLSDNKEALKKLENVVMPQKEFVMFKSADGQDLNAFVIKPLDFDSTKKYPVFMTQYSGPGSQQVLNRWGNSWEMELVKEGYIVACVDGRGTGARGYEFRSCTYGDLGKLEVEDQIAAAKQIAQLPYVDADRIGIYGWSYGGFMSLNCIFKGAEVFKMAIAVAPVTSWRFYDTIYTEIFNSTPQLNPKGYDDNSPIHFANLLKGKLLLVHGTADDNVHIQNSYRMIDALLDADKDFDWIIFPDRNHSMGSRRNYLYKKMVEYTKENL